jgi:integrase
MASKFGSIRKLSSGRFQVRYRDPKSGKDKTARTLDDRALTFASIKEAEIYLLHLKSDTLRGLSPYSKVKAKSYTLRQAVEQYLDPDSGSRLNSKPLRSSTLSGYRSLADGYIYRDLNNFCLADKEITKITRQEIRFWFSQIQVQCVSVKREVKTRANPARTWARSQGLVKSINGRISPEIIEAWKQAGAPIIKKYRDEPSGSVQLAAAYRLLKAVFNVALEDEIIESNPCRIKGAGYANHPERVIATNEQIAALIHEVPERYKASVLMAAITSIRASELFGLQRKHINPLKLEITIEHQLTGYSADPEMFVPTKTDAGNRTVPIPAGLMASIQKHMDQFTDPNADALIFTTSNGKPLYKGRRSWFVTAKRRLDLDHLHFHDLRHTGQTLAMEKGATVKDLQRRAGQASEQAAQVYVHGHTKRDRIVADSLESDVQDVISKLQQFNAS